MSASKPQQDFQLLAAAAMRRLRRSLQDPCAEAEVEPFPGEGAPEIVLSAAAARKAGRSLLFPADKVLDAPDWLVLCETRAEPGGARFGFAARLPGAAEPRDFVSRACALLWGRPADPAEANARAGRLALGNREDFLVELLAAPDVSRHRRFALLPLDGELTALFGVQGFDDMAPPRFVVED